MVTFKAGFHFSRNSRTNKRMLNPAWADSFSCIFADDSLWSTGSSNKLNFFGEYVSENQSDSENYQSNIVENSSM